MNGFWTAVFPTAGAIIVAIVTGAFGMFAGRRAAVSHIHGVIHEGFKALVRDLREQVEFQNRRIDELEGELMICKEQLYQQQDETRRLRLILQANGISS